MGRRFPGHGTYRIAGRRDEEDVARCTAGKAPFVEQTPSTELGVAVCAIATSFSLVPPCGILHVTRRDSPAATP